MKSYLTLVSEYAKVHKKKNRLTIVCIAISVMLVTTIFGMADMSVKAQINAYIQQNGNFHAFLKNISDDVAEQIRNRDDIQVSDWVGVAPDATYGGKRLIIQGSGQELAEQMNLTVLDGKYPSTAHEALLDKQAMTQFGLSIGDIIKVPFEHGQTREYRITGTYGEFSMLLGKDAHGLFLTRDGLREIGSEQYMEYYYIQFEKGVNIRHSLSEIKLQHNLSEEQVVANMILLGLMGQSDDSAMWQLYLTAGILFVLVTMAGIFMIAGNFNRNVLERTQFFGLLRCLGASKRQIKRYILIEGLQHCLKGIPLGLIAGCLMMWVSVFVLNTLDLRFVLPEMPLFQISWLGVVAGAVIGFLVVMVASRAPAKKAAEISPQAAVTGNVSNIYQQPIRKASKGSFKIDTSIGLNHAFSSKKNLILTAGSFALSIVLLLCFTVLIEFMNYATNPLKPYAPDISVMYDDNVSTIDNSVMEELKKLPHIKNLYGRMFDYNINAISKEQTGTVTLVSYDKPQFQWAEDLLISGKVENVKNSNGVLVGFDKAAKSSWKVGDVITLTTSVSSQELQVAGILSDMPFDAQGSEWILICSEPTFTALTGIEGYTIVDMQIKEDISAEVRNIIPSEMRLLDKQQSNQEVRTASYTMAVFVYGFVFVIAFVALINIVNTMSSSISNHMSNYGVMRAVGMSTKQLKKVVQAEAAAYVLVGSIIGGVLGLILHRIFFEMMVTSNWGQTWQPPFRILAIIIFGSILTTFISVIAPTRKIKKTSIVNVVNAG